MKYVYDALYEDAGYHHGLQTTHAAPLVEEISRHPDIHSVLDVGCSHGRGVELLWQAGKQASGVDLADRAIELAVEHRHPERADSCVGKCFQQASAAQLPFADKTFDAIMSTDVLEHVPEKLVPAVVQEFARVTRRAMFLKIAEKEELNTGALETLQRQDAKFRDVDHLHVTVHPLAWWVDQFASGSFKCTRKSGSWLYCSRSDDATSDNTDMKYVYDALYEDAGYHHGLQTTHAAPLVEEISRHPDIHSVLDVGCSHGRGVELLWQAGKQASGVDLADRAIELAVEHRHPERADSCVGKCFQQASAAQLPFADKTFDAIMSTDVLEHVPEKLVPAVVQEFARVTRRAMFLKIAVKEEVHTAALETLKRQDAKYQDVEHLHVTVHPLTWWVDQFASGSFKCKEKSGWLYCEGV